MRRPNSYLKSIGSRLTLSYLLITLLGFGIVLFFVSGIVESFLTSRRIAEQQSELYTFSVDMAQGIKGGDGEGMYRAAYAKAEAMGGRVLVLSPTAVVLADSHSALNGQRLPYNEVARVLWGADQSSYAYHRQSDQADRSLFLRLGEWLGGSDQWCVYQVCAVMDGNEKLGAVLLSVSIQDVLDSVGLIRARVSMVLLLVMLAAMLASMLTSRTITKPITELTRVIRRMSRGEQYARVTYKGSDELAQLGKTFNDMSERLENTERFRSEFVSNASHEIKTPLASMKILIESLLYQEKLDEGMAREFLGDINQEIDRLNLVITDLLRMVQLDQTDNEVKFETLELGVLCEEAVKRLGPIAGKKEIELVAQLGRVTLMGDKIKLEQMITNLVDNAIKYTDVGGKVWLRLKPGPSACTLEVEDTGIGIPKEDLAHIFDRFYRVDKARSRATGGTGLGLSIVERILKLHSGEIQLESQEGKGTKFTVTLPLKQ